VSIAALGWLQQVSGDQGADVLSSDVDADTVNNALAAARSVGAHLGRPRRACHKFLAFTAR
jgi:hypothetical protein